MINERHCQYVYCSFQLLLELLMLILRRIMWSLLVPENCVEMNLSLTCIKIYLILIKVVFLKEIWLLQIVKKIDYFKTKNEWKEKYARCTCTIAAGHFGNLFFCKVAIISHRVQLNLFFIFLHHICSPPPQRGYEIVPSPAYTPTICPHQLLLNLYA